MTVVCFQSYEKAINRDGDQLKQVLADSLAKQGCTTIGQMHNKVIVDKTVIMIEALVNRMYENYRQLSALPDYDDTSLHHLQIRHEAHQGLHSGLCQEAGEGVRGQEAEHYYSEEKSYGLQTIWKGKVPKNIQDV